MDILTGFLRLEVQCIGCIVHTISDNGKGHMNIGEDSLNTDYGCTFISEEQVSSTRDGRGRGGQGSGGEMGKLCGKTVTWMKT